MGLILVDLDMVIADFNAGFENEWQKRYPDRVVVPLRERKSFYVTKDYPQEYERDIEAIINGKDFLINLPPIEGAISGFLNLQSKYGKVRVCTTSLKNEFSSGEKWNWVRNHLGKKHAEEMIICNDKTIIRASHLIDDRPQIHGSQTPEWKHVIFTQPYNRHVIGDHFTWDNPSELV